MKSPDFPSIGREKPAYLGPEEGEEKAAFLGVKTSTHRNVSSEKQLFMMSEKHKESPRLGKVTSSFFFLCIVFILRNFSMSRWDIPVVSYSERFPAPLASARLPTRTCSARPKPGTRDNVLTLSLCPQCEAPDPAAPVTCMNVLFTLHKVQN